MQDPQMSNNNPLKKYFRQPKIYISLPSQGKNYPNGSLEMTENGEFPVYAMTAKDEIMMKTPDALISGQATVEVIESCVPNIKNGWDVNMLDLDAVLLGIRIATFGEKMDIDITTPITKEEKTYSVDMQKMLTDIMSEKFDDTIYLDSMTIRIRPLTYKEFTQNSMKTFEEQRVFNALNDNSMSEREKIEVFNRAFKNLTEMTINSIESSIISIDIEGESVTNPSYIKEFIDNADKNVFRAITKHIELQREKFMLKPLQIPATPEEIERGVPEVYTVPITFDPSNFFA